MLQNTNVTLYLLFKKCTAQSVKTMETEDVDQPGLQAYFQYERVHV